MMVPASAQDVLNEIVKMSQATVNDTTQNIVVRKTAVFKYDAMTYLRSKMLPASAVLRRSSMKSSARSTSKL